MPTISELEHQRDRELERMDEDVRNRKEQVKKTYQDMIAREGALEEEARNRATNQ